MSPWVTPGLVAVDDAMDVSHARRIEIVIASVPKIGRHGSTATTLDDSGAVWPQMRMRRKDLTILAEVGQ